MVLPILWSDDVSNNLSHNENIMVWILNVPHKLICCRFGPQLMAVLENDETFRKWGTVEGSQVIGAVTLKGILEPQPLLSVFASQPP